MPFLSLFDDTGTVTWSGLSGNDVATPGSCHFQDELLIARHGADIIRYRRRTTATWLPSCSWLAPGVVAQCLVVQCLVAGCLVAGCLVAG